MASELPTAVMWGGDECLDIVATDLTKNLVTRPRLLPTNSDAPMEARLEGMRASPFFRAYQHDGRQYLLCSQGFFRPLP